ncbi:Cuticle protein 16.8 like protein [Argiope bruennichi]|uniref:Cuticle protein 16.8 like protein n=1 Tax=Argiope bruennichi TaxID=94029 RepID=A0A8T0EJ58_ARGBR|nr:Cuticle protein 16.8 like protein [Argiope bruennichi]
MTTVFYFVKFPGSVENLLEFIKEYLKEWAKGVEPGNPYLKTLCNLLEPIYKFAGCDERDFSANVKIVMDYYLAKVVPYLPSAVQSLLESYRSDLVHMVTYEFGYEFGDGQGMNQHRRESSDGAGNVKGSYSYTDPYGVYRNVEYQADANGYRAVVKSNEPGLSNQNAADVTFLVEPPPPGAVLQQNLPAEAVANAL